MNKKPDARALKSLDLDHFDVAGPFSPVAKDGFEHSIWFLDDYFGMVFQYFMKHKSNTTLATAKFIANVAHIGKIKRLRTDNGGEPMEVSFTDLPVQNSIKHERSAPYSPQRNGTGEPVLTWPDVCYWTVDCLNICGHMHYQQVDISGTVV